MTAVYGAPQAEVLVDVRDLAVHFPVKGSGFAQPAQVLRAVDGVSFTLARGKSLGIVGESGCGKTTAAMALVGLTDATGGTIHIDGVPVTTRPAQRPALARRVQLVFQDPYSSLNPRMTVGEALHGPLRLHRLHDGDRDARVAQLLEAVGLRPEHAARFPHEFSGGQRQRIGIARALALEPALLVGDEPVSALDVSVQAQILNLLLRLQDTLGLSMIIISHNLAVIEHLCDEVAVMYLGRIVEQGSVADIIGQPLHPYTQALIAAAPGGDLNRDANRDLNRAAGKTGKTHKITPVLQGDLPSPLNPPAGCPLHPRCPRASQICHTTAPPLVASSAVARGSVHTVSCHHV